MQTHRYTDTHGTHGTHRHTDTETHTVHIDTQTHRHIDTQTHTVHTNMHYARQGSHIRMDCSAVCKRLNLHTANQRVPLWAVCWYALSPFHPLYCHTPPPPPLHQYVGMHYLLSIVILLLFLLTHGVLVCAIFVWSSTLSYFSSSSYMQMHDQDQHLPYCIININIHPSWSQKFINTSHTSTNTWRGNTLAPTSTPSPTWTLAGPTQGTKSTHTRCVPIPNQHGQNMTMAMKILLQCNRQILLYTHHDHLHIFHALILTSVPEG